MPLLKRKSESRKTVERPYIRDAWQPLDGPADFATVAAVMIVLALVIGFAVGFLVFLVMNLSMWLSALLWNAGGLWDMGQTGNAGGTPTGLAWFPLVVCTIGGVIIGVWTHVSGNRVQPLEKVMEQFRQTGSYDLGGAGKATVSFLLPLVFGGSIGFEAGLTGLITAGCCWIRDKLKAAGLREAAVADVTIAASIAAIFGTPLAGIVAGAESSPEDAVDVDDYNMRKSVKLVLYTAAAFGAFAGISAFSALFGTTSGFPRFDAIAASGTEYLWALLALAFSYLLAILYHTASIATNGIANGLSTLFGQGAATTVLKPTIAGIVIGFLAMFFPYVLFPGETQSHELMQTWTSWTAVALIMTGLLKAIATPTCINLGWVGGNFCPSIFAGAACGYGLSLITGADPMLMVTVVTTGFLAGVTRKPVLSIAILMLCFPAQDIIWMGLAAIIVSVLPVPQRSSE